jgi:hypothetical protein
MKTASEIAAILAADVEDFRAGFKLTAKLFDVLPPGAVRDELIRRNQKIRRVIEELPRRIYDRQPFANKAAAEIAVQAEMDVILRLMDELQAVYREQSSPLQT